MSETNKTLRIRTEVNGVDTSNVFVNLDQTYDTFEILSLKLRQTDVYKLHSANYGVIVGRVLANGNFGVPNAKISIFIEGNFEDEELSNLYPYTSTASEDKNGIRYNLLPDEKIDDCHQVVGTFPNKTYLLDNDVLIEVFDTYYKYTTRTNNSGDYIIAGVPTGNHTLHMDLDLSDCGILSQRPRDFVYKGYTIEQFENANQFKTDTNLASLSQIFSQDQVVNVIPFWGNENQGETIGITRADISISFKFEPTCIFMGSLVADNSSNGISKKCVPTNQMGAMDELTTGEGTIEMIRYTPGGNIESFNIRGTQLIDGNGVWCYQIPMNLDYMMTDEYGNMVPTDDPEKGIPTRTRVRFRFSMHDMEKNTDNYFRAKVLVPHNPQNLPGDAGKHEDYDYEFGSDTRVDSFRDLLWNNVYTVKSYIPRFQKSKTSRETQRFTGIKHCNYYGNNNPMPYNNIRIKLPLMFTILCALIKSYIRIVYIVNNIINAILHIIQGFATGVEILADAIIGWIGSFIKLLGRMFNFNTDWADISTYITKPFQNTRYLSVADGLCPDLENWYFAPVKKTFKKEKIDVLQQTLDYLVGKDGQEPEDKNIPLKDENNDSSDYQSIDKTNPDESSNNVCLTIYTDYLIACIEMALAQEYRVINFDFYNDWVNGVIYMPRWMRFVRPKRTFLFGLIKIRQKIKACMDDTSIFNKTRYYVQQCALSYKKDKDKLYTDITTYNGCVSTKPTDKKQKCHKRNGKVKYGIFGGSKSGKVAGNGGIVHENETMRGEYVYYLKPCEWRRQDGNKKVNLFANDIVLLGSLLDCNLYGIPQAFKYLTSSSYIMPTNLALTNMDDDGYLYADDKGTICNNTGNTLDSGLTVTQVDNSFKGLVDYYSVSQEPLEYGRTEGDDLGEVYDDSIPITEAAGIAWNYTGPGQGKKSEYVNKSLYMPGGHFLGISCTNSETNIKTCVNLERICEIGSNMSQRREEVRKIVGTTNEFQYRYFVPTGLIANDEVNGSSFRSMFATMNHKRLLCENRFDEKTGYPIYDFIYLRTNGFDGSLKNKIKNVEWNKQLNIIDESSEFPDIKKDVNYDYNETDYTNTRTIEELKQDYYKFRLGLDNLSDEEQIKKFLKYDGTSVSLPQYENSFYFYFGLRDGATAFDEFLKQFFSVCDTSSRLKQNMSINVTKENINLCGFNSDIVIEGKNAVGIVTGRYEYYTDCEEDVQTQQLPPKQTVNGEFEYCFSDNEGCDLPSLPFGTYKFIITDENGNTVTKEIEVGKDVITSRLSSVNFEFRTSVLINDDDIIYSGMSLDCGYIQIDNLNYNGSQFPGDLSWSTIMSNLVIIENTTKKYFGGNIEKIPVCFWREYTPVYSNIFGDDGKIYVWKPDVSYDIYLTSLSGNICKGYIKLGTVYVEGIDNYDLYLGSYLLPYSTELSKDEYNYNTEWWRNIGGNSGDTILDWAKRYALYRRTDYSADTFTNKVFAVNVKGKVVDTALFGEPENPFGQPQLMYDVLYEGDELIKDGVVYSLTDASVKTTTLSSADTFTHPTDERHLFGEMAINGNVIISDKIGSVIPIEWNTIDEHRSYFKVDNSDTVITNSKLKNKHGCLAKLEDGTILYCIKDGNKFEYDGEIPDDVSSPISIYPIFYYPVINRPFYAKVYIADWLSANIVETNGGELIINHDVEQFTSQFEIHNGLTFEYKFGLLQIQDIDFTESGRTSDTDATGTDAESCSESIDGNPKDVIFRSGVTISGGSHWDSGSTVSSDDDQYVIETYDMYSYTITENGPKPPKEDSDEQYKNDYAKLINPYPIELNTIEDSTTLDLASVISYRIDTGANGIRFYKDTNDNNIYYLVKKENGKEPLKQYRYVYKQDESKDNVYYMACTFGPHSDEKLKVRYVDPDESELTKFVNKPGDYVFVEVYKHSAIGGIFAAGMKIPYYDTNKAETKKYKKVAKEYYESMVSGTSDIYDKLVNDFDITPLFTFDWKDEGINAKTLYEDITNSAITSANTSTTIDFNEVINVMGIQVISAGSEDEGRIVYLWNNIADYYVVGFETYTNTNNRFEKNVNGMGSTVIYRIYDGKNMVQLPNYDSGAIDPYLKIEPHGIEGIPNEEPEPGPEPPTPSTRNVTVYPTGTMKIEHNTNPYAYGDSVNFYIEGVGNTDSSTISYACNEVHDSEINTYSTNGSITFYGITTAATTVTLQLNSMNFERDGHFYGTGGDFGSIDVNVGNQGTGWSGSDTITLNVVANASDTTVYLDAGYGTTMVYDY